MKKLLPTIVLLFLIITLSFFLNLQKIFAQPTDEPQCEVVSVEEDQHVLIFAQDFPAFSEIEVTMWASHASAKDTFEITTTNAPKNGSFFKLFHIPTDLAGEEQIEIRMACINHTCVTENTFINQTFINNEAAKLTWDIIRTTKDTSGETSTEKPAPLKTAEHKSQIPLSIEVEASNWLQSGSENGEREDPVLFIWPAEQRWLSGYDFSVSHPGIDIAAIRDDLIFAAASGEVIAVNYSNRGYGNMVMIDHLNGYKTLYAHLNKILVETGCYVIQGQPIGLAGSTGNSSGVHLHFEIHFQGRYVNPWLFFDS